MRATIRLAPDTTGRDGRIEVIHSLIIGRAPTNDYVIPLASVSRVHAVIRRADPTQNSFEILDLGSFNGTYVDDREVTAPTRLGARSIIRMGDQKLIFEMVHDTEAAKSLSKFGESVLISELVVTLVCDVRPPPVIGKVPAVTPMSWTKAVIAIVDEQGGFVDRFVGDRVVCYWANTSTNATVTAGVSNSLGRREGFDALEAARRIMAEANKMPHWPDRSPFRVGIALHTGMAAFERGRNSSKPVLIGTVLNESTALATAGAQHATPMVASGYVLALLPVDTEAIPLGSERLAANHDPVKIFGLAR